MFPNAGGRISKEEDSPPPCFLIWKHCIFQQKRKLDEGEVKGHYFGNNLDAAYFPVQVNMCVCVCVKAERSVPKLQGFIYYS